MRTDYGIQHRSRRNGCCGSSVSQIGVSLSAAMSPCTIPVLPKVEAAATFNRGSMVRGRLLNGEHKKSWKTMSRVSPYVWAN